MKTDPMAVLCGNDIPDPALGGFDASNAMIGK